MKNDAVAIKKRSAGRRPRAVGTAMDTRAVILAAARKVFAQQGINGTTVREVASAAKINNAMIYYHFRDKADLYRAVLSDSFSSLTDIWVDPIFLSPVSVRDKIKKYIEGYIRFQQVNEDLRRIMAMEFASSSGNITWICEKYFADNITRLTALLKEGIRTGELKKCNPSLAVTSLIGIIVHGFIMQPMAELVHGKKADLSPIKFGAFVTELFFKGLSKRP